MRVRRTIYRRATVSGTGEIIGSRIAEDEIDLVRHDECHDLFVGNLRSLTLEYPDRTVTLVRKEV